MQTSVQLQASHRVENEGREALLVRIRARGGEEGQEQSSEEHACESGSIDWREAQ